jgi:hypothetical protein
MIINFPILDVKNHKIFSFVPIYYIIIAPFNWILHGAMKRKLILFNEKNFEAVLMRNFSHRSIP